MVDYRKIDDPAKLHALLDAILILEGDADLSTLLRVLVEQATTLASARYGALGILSSDGDRLDEFITVGIPGDDRAAIGAFPIGKGLLRRVITDAAPLRVDHLSAHPDRSGFPANHPPMESFLGVPVRLGQGTVFGNLYLCEKLDGSTFSEEDMALTDTLGRAAGLLIEKAQLRLRLTELTLANERERMARDLHDTVIQRLFAVGLMLQGASNAEIPDGVRSTLRGAVDDLDQTIREIRTTIFAITRGSGDGSDTLRRRLLELTDEVGGRLGLAVSIEFDGPVDTAVSSRAADQALLATREMLSNVIRHAAATSATVAVSASATGLTIRIADDGCGIDLSIPSRGNGLANLKARAVELDGWCTVSKDPAGGTVAEWHVTQINEERP